MTKSLKDLQAEYYDNVPNLDFELHRPRGQPLLYQYLMQFKFDLVCDLMDGSVTNTSVLCVCCGSGMDAEFLTLAGADVVAVDISMGAVLRARQRGRMHGSRYHVMRADVTCLPFQNGTFDYAFVHDGLHHLDDPQRGLAEMARVARRGVIITEPADALITASLTRLGLAQLREESGNNVRRIGVKELTSWCKNEGLTRVHWSRYLLKYGHPPAEWWHVFDNRVALNVAAIMFRLVGVRLLGRWGNKLALVGEREARELERADSIGNIAKRRRP